MRYFTPSWEDSRWCSCSEVSFYHEIYGSYLAVLSIDRASWEIAWLRLWTWWSRMRRSHQILLIKSLERYKSSEQKLHSAGNVKSLTIMYPVHAHKRKAKLLPQISPSGKHISVRKMSVILVTILFEDLYWHFHVLLARLQFDAVSLIFWLSQLENMVSCKGMLQRVFTEEFPVRSQSSCIGRLIFAYVNRPGSLDLQLCEISNIVLCNIVTHSAIDDFAGYGQCSCKQSQC